MGCHFRSKKFHCNFFCIRNGNFGNEFAEKIAMKFSEKGAGGSKAVQKFSKNLSILVGTGSPKRPVLEALRLADLRQCNFSLSYSVRLA